MTFGLPDNVESLVCCGCGYTTRDPWEWSCPSCEPEYRMDVVYKSDAAASMKSALAGRAFDMWRYRELLPIPRGAKLPPLYTGDGC